MKNNTLERYSNNLLELDVREDSDKLVGTFWDKDNGMNCVYLEIRPKNGEAGVMVQVDPSQVKEALEHPYLFAASAVGEFAAKCALGIETCELKKEAA